jgi:DNA-binding NtrC family response regulator
VADHTRTQPVGELLRTGTGEPSPQLVLVMNSNNPSESTVRVLLNEFQDVLVGRGPARAFTIDKRQRGKQSLRVALADDFVSTQHVRFSRANGGWWFEDLGSKNGTFLDGERTAKASLYDQALIEIGGSLFLYRIGEVHDAQPIVSDDQLAAPSMRLRTFNGALAAQFAQLAAVAGSRTSVLALGETGTGKGVLARALHELSGRSPFVAVNLATISENLLTAELFGYRKGAFSGAVADHRGLVRAADGGTLFLDELGDLPAAAQSALLLMLQDREVLPIGHSSPVAVDVRVVAATNKDLPDLVEAGHFRRDLLARLEGLTLRLPPLVDRREDLGLLIREIVHRESSCPGAVTLGNLAARALMLYEWPGNIRELEKVLTAAMSLSRGAPIETKHLPEALRSRLTGVQPGASACRVGASSREGFDPKSKQAVVELLRRFGGNVSAAARSIGKKHQQLHKWIKAHGIDVESLRLKT